MGHHRSVLRIGALVGLCTALVLFVQTSQADFGEAVVYEAVDLSEASQQSEGKEDAKTMESLLHWAIEHSDPDKLRQLAREKQREQDGDGAILDDDEVELASKDRRTKEQITWELDEKYKLQDEQMQQQLEEKRKRVQELMEIMKSQAPSETELMKEAIAVLNGSSTEDEVLRALQALSILVEPIDNANDLKALNGLDPLVELLSPKRSAAVRSAAADVLGKAASNNLIFHHTLLMAHPHVFHDLLAVASDPDPDTSAKGLYAVGALARNTELASRAFAAARGLQHVAALLAAPGSAPRVRRKALSLLQDLVEVDDVMMASALVEPGLPKAVLSLLDSDDLDTVEKSLEAIKVLVARGMAGQVLAELGAATKLHKLRQRLLAEGSEQAEAEDLIYHTYLIRSVDDVEKLIKEGQKPQALGGAARHDEL